MSSLITNATIQIRKDTAGNWTSNNPTPAAGELCLETDTKHMKIGDGSTAWTSLSYFYTKPYTTGWINRSDWTNVHLGSSTSKDVDSNLNHALSAPLSELIVKVFISTDGTDANSYEAQSVVASTVSTNGVGYGVTAYDIDDNNIIIQTGSLGIVVLKAVGTLLVIDTENYYYKVVVTRI